jgi:NAD(P)-dependent dehydrogenase (short-subunit alcohol dehydrogenase family)
MNINLNGKIALVSGSTAGIGLAIAQGLAEAGAEIIVNGRTDKRIESAINEIVKKSPQAKVVGIAADMSTAEGTAKTIQKFPQVDILVNNMGIFEPKPFFEIPDSDWLRFFEANVLSGIRLARHYTPLMVKKGWVHISEQSGHPFRTNPATHFGAKRPPVSVQSGHLCRVVC